MRSSVVDTRRVADSDVQGKRYSPPVAPSYRDAQDIRSAINPKSHPKQAVRLAPMEGWLALFLLAIAVYCVVYAIVQAHWVSHSPMLLWSPAVGLLVGLIVAKLPRLPQAALHLGACLLGHWFSIWLTSEVTFHINWLFLLGSIKAIILGGLSPSALPNTDTIFFFYLTFLSFFLAYFGCWLIYRAHLPWLVAFVYCSIMLVNLNSYTRQDLSYLLIIMLAALLLLIARIQLAAQVIQWTQEGLHTNHAWLRSLARRCMQIASVLTLIAIIGTSLLPVAKQSTSGQTFWNALDNAWNNITNGQISWQNPASAFQPYQPSTNFFSDHMTISGNVHLPTGEVLSYVSSNGPRYLEGFTYDQFDGHTWSTLINALDSSTFSADTALKPDIIRNDYQQITSAITLVQPPENTQHYLFAPAQPIRFDVATNIDNNGTASAWMQQSNLVSGEHYQVTSLLPPSDAQTLSGIPLPNDNPSFWLADGNANMLQTYYMQLPHNLSPNLLKTTQQWTQGANNTYQALKMIESHLNDTNTFTYSLDNPPIPANVDVVDWLLQTHKGYCTYYASAMVVMARQLGIPARMVNGFSYGHYDAQHKIWVVDGNDAHSWVQAYLPSFGWINFDPTPGYSLTAINHPQPTPTPAKPAPTPKPVSTTTPKPVSPPKATPAPNTGSHPTTPKKALLSSLNMSILAGFSLLLLLCSLCLFLFALARHWWRNLYANSSRVSGLFWRLCQIASWGGLSPRSTQTPYEYSRLLSQQFPQNAHAIWNLTELFVRDRWGSGQHVPHPQEEDHAEQVWHSMRGFFLTILLRRRRK